VVVLKNYSGSHSVNIGFGEDLTIAANGGGGRRLSRQDCLRSLKTRRHAAKTGRRFAPGSHGWNAKVSLREGLGKAYPAFLTDAVRGAVTGTTKLRPDLLLHIPPSVAQPISFSKSPGLSTVGRRAVVAA
jgi:hypothetical protein